LEGRLAWDLDRDPYKNHSDSYRVETRSEGRRNNAYLRRHTLGAQHSRSKVLGWFQSVRPADLVRPDELRKFSDLPETFTAQSSRERRRLSWTLDVELVRQFKSLGLPEWERAVYAVKLGCSWVSAHFCEREHEVIVDWTRIRQAAVCCLNPADTLNPNNNFPSPSYGQELVNVARSVDASMPERGDAQWA
jgi:hypothetical protein